MCNLISIMYTINRIQQNTSMKRHKLSECINKENPTLCYIILTFNTEKYSWDEI